METLSWGNRYINEQLHCRVLCSCDKNEIKVLWPDWGCSEEEKSGKVETKTEPGKKKAGLGGGGTGQSRQDWQHTHWPRDERHGEHSESIILKGVKRE